MESDLFNENVRLQVHYCNSTMIFVVMKNPCKLYDLLRITLNLVKFPTEASDIFMADFLSAEPIQQVSPSSAMQLLTVRRTLRFCSLDIVRP